MTKQLKMKCKMRQRSLCVDERSLFEKLCDLNNLRAGFKAVKKNGGAPGIDGVTIEEFESRLKEELVQLQMEIASWNYKPSRVRRVEIPKPGKGAGVRLLGVPCTRDRVVQATIKLLLEPILDLSFQTIATVFVLGIASVRPWKQHSGLFSKGKSTLLTLIYRNFWSPRHTAPPFMKCLSSVSKVIKVLIYLLICWSFKDRMNLIYDFYTLQHSFYRI